MSTDTRGPVRSASTAVPSTNQHFRPSTARFSAGRWEVGGCALEELADRFGTPLYVLDATTLEEACRAYLDALSTHYPGPAEVVYASKANCNLAVNRLVYEAGIGNEVVSGGELYTALRAGVPAARVFFQGNNKSAQELTEGLAAGVGRIMVDNLDELRLLSRIAAATERTTDVILRLTPGVDTQTHAHIRTGQVDSKFGIDLSEVDEAATLLRAEPRLRFRGLQCHLGSQLFDTEPFRQSARVLLQVAQRLRRDHGLATEDLDLGGGLGIAYLEGDAPPSIDAWVAVLADAVVAGCQELDLPLPRLVVEPGRTLVGPAGCTVYTVGSAKQVPGGRRYVAVDGGMGDNPRPVTYGARYTVEPVREGHAPAGVPTTLAGKCCETGDLLVVDAGLPDLAPGDRVVVWATGAYNFSLASNYNRLPRPAMVLVRDGRAELVRARETYADLVALDRLPAWLFPAAGADA